MVRLVGLLIQGAIAEIHASLMVRVAACLATWLALLEPVRVLLWESDQEMFQPSDCLAKSQKGI
jgi:hypothetical protein